jgi:hypothetical protein
MLGLAFSGKSMPGTGGVWCLFADGWDDVPALCGPAGRICRPGAPRQGAEAGYASDRNSPARIGRSQRAVDISLAAQQVVPKSAARSSRATAQEGRAWATIGVGPETRAALGRVEALVSPLPVISVGVGSLAGWLDATTISAWTRTWRQLPTPQAPSWETLSPGHSGVLSAPD